MLKKWFVFAALLAVLPSFALDGVLMFTLVPNAGDQFEHIMPFRSPNIPHVDYCVRRQPVMLHLALANPASGTGGKVLVEVESIRSINANGKVRELIDKPIVAFRGVKKNAGDFSGIMLVNPSVKVIIPGSEPLGKLRMVATVCDRMDGSKREFVAELKVVETLPGAPKKPMTAEAMSKFMTDYYKAPDPAKIPAAFAAFLRFDDENSGKKRSYDPLMWLCGFTELYRLNPQLRPSLIRGAANYSGYHKLFVALILAEVGAAESELKDADTELRQLFGEIKSRGKTPLSFDEITNPAQLDALWTIFLVTGKVEPIRRLVNEMRTRPDAMTLEEAKKLGRKPTEAEMKRIMSGLIGNAAEWSLSSNAKEHELVAYYLEAMLMRKEYPDPVVAVKLGGMLIKAGLLEVAEKPGGGKVLKSVISPSGKKTTPQR